MINPLVNMDYLQIFAELKYANFTFIRPYLQRAYLIRTYLPFLNVTVLNSFEDNLPLYFFIKLIILLYRVLLYLSI